MGARVLIVLGGCLAAGAAVAQSAPTSEAGSWMLGIGGQVDEDDNQSVLTSFNWGVGRNTWLTFGLGQSSSPADRADVEADTLSIAVDQRFDLVGFTLTAEQWGDSGALETDDLGASIYFARERWRLAVGYQSRDIEIPFTLTGPLGGTLRRTVSLGGDTYSIDARAGIAERWNLYLRAAEYDYERDLNVLPRIDRLNLLSTSTLTLANSFIDDERSLGLEREFARVLLNVRVATDHSAIDGSKFETFDAAVLFPVGGRVDLEVNVGAGRSDLFGRGLYGGLLVLVYGR